METITPPLLSKGAFSIPDACTHLSVKRSTLYKLIKTKRLRARKIGRRTVILASDLADFLNDIQKGSV